MITVNELINLLKDEDPNAVVMLSCDSEGNYFSPLDKGFAVSTVGEDKECDVYYNRDFLSLPDETKTLIMYPMD